MGGMSTEQKGRSFMARQPGNGVLTGVSPSPLVRQSGAMVALLVAAVVAAFGVSRQPLYAAGGVLAIALAWFTAQRLWLAVSLLVASFYFEGYPTIGLGFLTAAKLVGVLAMAAWFLAWSSGRQAIVTVELFWPVAGLAAWILLSLAMAYDQSAAIVVASRYLMFFVLVFLVVQTVDGRLSRATQLAAVAVASAAVAALIGLLSFFLGGADRATGPLEDPNDFGFLLAVTVPLAMHQFQIALGPPRRFAAALALALILAGTLATFSRGAIVGLAVAGAFSLLTRRLRARWALLFLVGALLIAGTANLLQPQTVGDALTRKQHIAQSNVNERLVAWRIALDEFGSSPLLGVGPGNFERRYIEFGLHTTEAGPVTTHNAYLNILAELGLPGLVLFLGYLAVSWRVLRHRIRDDPAANAFRSSLAAGFVVALVGSMFLTEQYYAPLWLLPALGATLARVRAARSEPLEPVG
jgi:putative inorganic carbon (hco3(-)) transporter